MQPTLWLATPDAASRFDPEIQPFADRQRWSRMGAAARARTDWRVSRALLAHVQPSGFSSSLSHSGGFAALAVAGPGTRVGVDIEVVEQRRDIMRLARFAFAPEEVAQLDALAVHLRTERFYSLWTLKEACIKAFGLGLFEGLRRYAFTIESGRWQGRIAVKAGWEARLYRPRPDLYLALASSPPTGEWTRHEWPVLAPAAWPIMIRAGTDAATGD